MEHTKSTATKMTEHDREMAEKLERIVEDPEAYYAEARRVAYRDEFRRALMPWRKPHSRPA